MYSLLNMYLANVHVFIVFENCNNLFCGSHVFLDLPSTNILSPSTCEISQLHDIWLSPGIYNWNLLFCPLSRNKDAERAHVKPLRTGKPRIMNSIQVFCETGTVKSGRVCNIGFQSWLTGLTQSVPLEPSVCERTFVSHHPMQFADS